MPTSATMLVFLPNWVGDVVMATPLLRTLRTRQSAAGIVYVGRPVALATLQGCPWCDATISDQTQAGGGWYRSARLIRRLRETRPDTALLLPNSFRTALLARLSGAARRIGYARDGRTLLLTDRLSPPRDARGQFLPSPMIDYYARLLAPLGLTLDARTMELPLPPAQAEQADALLRKAGHDPTRPTVMLNPGAAFGTSKLWPAESFARAANALAESHGAQILLNAAPNSAERALAEKIAAALHRPPLLNLARVENTIGLLKALLRRCDLLITNDTGARHVAAAMGAAVVTLFGSTDPDWTRIDYPAERIVRIDVPCGPCQKKTCPRCPSAPPCLTGISVPTVVAAAEELLAKRGRIPQ